MIEKGYVWEFSSTTHRGLVYPVDANGDRTGEALVFDLASGYRVGYEPGDMEPRFAAQHGSKRPDGRRVLVPHPIEGALIVFERSSDDSGVKTRQTCARWAYEAEWRQMQAEIDETLYRVVKIASGGSFDILWSGPLHELVRAYPPTDEDGLTKAFRSRKWQHERYVGLRIEIAHREPAGHLIWEALDHDPRLPRTQ